MNEILKVVFIVLVFGAIYAVLFPLVVMLWWDMLEERRRRKAWNRQ